jgi:hypothetical protein
MCGKVLAGYLPVSIDVTYAVDPDFHGFLCDRDLAMWIWLESHAAFEVVSFFSNRYQISVLFVHSLWTDHRRHSSLFA